MNTEFSSFSREFGERVEELKTSPFFLPHYLGLAP